VLGTHNNAISDVAWAPDMGRSFHVIATASREPSFKVREFSSLLSFLITVVCDVM
jgi:hypothetical protein